MRDYGHDGQIGLEPTPDEYVARMVDVFRQVRRVLRDDGTLWLNLGDSYAGHNAPGFREGNEQKNGGVSNKNGVGYVAGMKPKDLVGIPWRVAFALQQPYYAGTIKDERDRIWLAAVIEAEGCLFIHKRKAGTDSGAKYTKTDGEMVSYARTKDTYGSGLEVSSTDRVIVERCMEIAGIGSICEQSPEQNERRKQTIYRWNVRSNECRGIIRELYPHFLAKQHEARLLLGCPSSGDDAARAHVSLKAIHQGGTPSIDFAPPESMFEPGWYLRAEIIWAKKNCTPESVTDRPTKSHEQIFLLTKSPRYWFDQEAVREKYQDSTIARDAYGYNHAFANQFRGSPTDARHPNGKELPPGSFAKGPDGRRKTSVQAGDGSIQHRDGERWPNGGRNVRSVWEIATQPYAEAHFATYPQELVRRCLLAGCPEWVCGTCGKPRERIVERGESDYARLKREQGHEWTDMDAAGLDRGVITRAGEGGQTRNSNGTVPSLRSADTETVGWSDCGHDNYQPGTVLDPFLGSGTTALVARNHSRRSIGIELNQEYCELAARRLAQQSLLAGEAA